MNAKIKTIGLSAILCMIAMAPSLCGGSTDTLVVHITNDASADILVQNTTGGAASWYPTAGIGEEDSTTDTYYNCSNNGSVQIDVTIMATVTTGTWALGAAAAHDTLYLGYNNTQTTDWTEITTGELSFVDDLAHDGYERFGLKIIMPTSTSVSADHEVTITFTATAD